jgi:hypothetical protein
MRRPLPGCWGWGQGRNLAGRWFFQPGGAYWPVAPGLPSLRVGRWPLAAAKCCRPGGAERTGSMARVIAVQGSAAMKRERMAGASGGLVRLPGAKFVEEMRFEQVAQLRSLQYQERRWRRWGRCCGPHRG